MATPRRRKVRRRLIAVLSAAGMWAVAVPGMAAPIPGGPDPLPASVVFVARNDVPFDSLAAGPVAAMLGAPVVITSAAPPLADAAKAAITQAAPTLVIIAGGESAISPDVEAEIEQLCGCPAERAAGPGRNETAAVVAALLDRYGIGRPLLTGAQVAGDAWLDGTLHTQQVIAAGVDLGAELAALRTENEQLRADLGASQTEIDDLRADLTTNTAATADLRADLDELLATLEGVSRQGRTIEFSGVNLQITNGEGNSPDLNGAGNLIIDNNEPFTCSGAGCIAAGRAGSHNLVIGTMNRYSSYGGIVAGIDNAMTGPYATITGGAGNTASGFGASVTGGSGSTASASYASVSGGYGNTASADYASISGGDTNTASGETAWVGGGAFNTASGIASAVSGGEGNVASGDYASISGGTTNTVSGSRSSVSGGFNVSIAGTCDWATAGPYAGSDDC